MKGSILKFLKDRLLLVVIFSIIFAIIRHLNIREIIYFIVILTAVLVFHNLLHELGHAISATLLGLKIKRFTLNRVYLEDEPSSFEEIKNSKNKVKYGIVAISGSIITILFGYILLYFAHGLRQGIRLSDYLCWAFTLIIFLLGDCGYLMTGSLSIKGDPVGISAGFSISKYIVFWFGLIIAFVNTLLFWRFFWIAS